MEFDDIFGNVRADILQYKVHAKICIECALRRWGFHMVTKGWNVNDTAEYLTFDYKTPNCGHIEFTIELTGWGGPVQKCESDIISIPVVKTKCDNNNCPLCYPTN